MKVQHKEEGRQREPRTIGKLAKEAKVSVETVRFYERRGLLRQPQLPIRGWRGLFLRLGAKSVRGQDRIARQQDRANEGHAQGVKKGSGGLREEKRHRGLPDRAKV